MQALYAREAARRLKKEPFDALPALLLKERAVRFILYQDVVP
jgi:hypothetical protein